MHMYVCIYLYISKMYIELTASNKKKSQFLYSFNLKKKKKQNLKPEKLLQDLEKE